MEQICCGKSKPICREGLPIILSTNNNKNKNPYMVTENLAEDGVVNFHTIEDGQPSTDPRRIPELQHLGVVRVHGVCHGWMILSNAHEKMWSLWNPLTSKLIRLPPLPPLDDDSDFIAFGCLSSPPGDPTSILLLTRENKPHFVFCRLVSQRKKSRSRWTEMSYAKQLQRLRGGGEEEAATLSCLTCCNGKVYALLFHDTLSVVQINIKVVKDKEGVKDKQVVISISPFLKYPDPYSDIDADFYVLKECGTELFAISGRFHAPAAIYVYKLDMTSTHETTWEEINDLKDAMFFVDMDNIVPVSYIPAVASGLGGYVHVRDFDRRIFVNSFHVKDKILVQLLPMPCLVKAIQVSMGEYRGLEAGNDRQVKCKNVDKQQEEDKENDDPIVVLSNIEEDGESCLLDVPFHVLEMIVERCVGIEYMNLRATCKRCHLAAPPIHWQNKTALTKLQKYSLSSPWLMVVEANGGIMNFTDPISGEKYFMKLGLPEPLSLNYDEHNSKSCSKYGWLLFYAHSSNLGDHQLVFFNPFTNDVRKLPPTPPHYLETLCFSGPPTSDDCVVVGFSKEGHAAYILQYHVDLQEEQLWRRFDVDYGGADREPYAFYFPTFHGRDLYAFCNEGQLVVFKDMSEGSFCQPEVVAAEPPECPTLFLPQYFLMECDQNLLLVIVDKFGVDPQLFQFNDSTKEWNQIQSLDKHAIFIGDATCVCVEAKTTSKMQNKIYFPRLKDGKLIFYSLETSKYHTFDGRLATREEAFGFKFQSFHTHLSLHAWIEPTWY